jgi:hypothetical protein
MVTAQINSVMHRQMVDGIRYEPIPDLHWEMRRLEPEASEEIERYAARLYKVQSERKTLYDHIEVESEVERRFAKGLDDNVNVRFFMKLPAWFTVDTPIGRTTPTGRSSSRTPSVSISSGRRRDPSTRKRFVAARRQRFAALDDTSTRSGLTTP